ncbi:hypothetical protein [Clavibacter sp. Sh2088]|uniref:hypothetical protein n=1 Tax=Clavibacter sp. Sh2088 TaxID=3397676 RepID=UPI0039E06E0F
MTVPNRERSLIIHGNVAVVFDDHSRIQWRRTDTGWALLETWPNAAETQLIDAHRENGGCLLVISDGRPIVTDALASELPSHVHEPSAADEPVQFQVDHFDWLPADLRARGEAFLAEQRTYWASRPALLRPPVSLDTEDPFDPLARGGHVTFAVVAPTVSRSQIERDLIHYLEFIGADRAATRLEVLT